MSMTASSTRSRKVNKSRMLVVDDEPDNLDLLYRTFRREFNVLRAESGQEALKILKEQGEVAVIISDQRMPEMKGTEFLSKTVPEFPDTVRIILTGFTDVEDLVDAINAGQVYRYITKPWDPDALKRVVQRAAETYEILKQRGDAIEQAQAQAQLVTNLTQGAAAASSLEAALPSLAAAVQEALGASGCVLYRVSGDGLVGPSGTSGQGTADLLKDDSLVETAIAQKAPQTLESTTGNARAEQYQAAGVQALMVAPVVFQDTVCAIVACQWAEPQTFSENKAQLLTLAATHLGLTLAYLNK